MGEPTGKKVIHAYDPAVMDYEQWHCWKQSMGVYILTREKTNSALIKCGERDWDKTDPCNIGVLKDEQVGPANGRLMRRITYRDPVSGKIYCFLTNEMTLPAGLLAFIYKCRWDIEKVFDQLKNKLEEKKAWGKVPRPRDSRLHL